MHPSLRMQPCCHPPKFPFPFTVSLCSFSLLPSPGANKYSDFFHCNLILPVQNHNKVETCCVECLHFSPTQTNALSFHWATPIHDASLLLKGFPLCGCRTVFRSLSWWTPGLISIFSSKESNCCAQFHTCFPVDMFLFILSEELEIKLLCGKVGVDKPTKPLHTMLPPTHPPASYKSYRLLYSFQHWSSF